MTNGHELRGMSERPSPEPLKEFAVSVPQACSVEGCRPNVAWKPMNDEEHPTEGDER